MAAATSAVLGSYFGAIGTVGGAAAGAAATTITTTLYQRSLERTRDTVKARVARKSEGTVARGPRPRIPRHPSVAVLLGGTVLIFAVGLAVVTAVEWVKGSPLSGGDSGTSVGRVIAPQPVAPPVPEPAPPEDTAPSRSEVPKPSEVPPSRDVELPLPSVSPTSPSGPPPPSLPPSLPAPLPGQDASPELPFGY
jgi:hypothetical protein